jgi:hypothetical protein
MLERMKRDLIATSIRSNDLHESYKYKQAIMKEEGEKCMRSKE